jgi:hemerythrin-like domain-containing protein
MSATLKTTQNPTLEAAIALLMADHDTVRSLFREYKMLMDYDAPAAQREDMALRICNALSIHAAIEDEVFYPAARSALAEDAEECLDHAEVEHGSITELIADILASSADDSLFDARVHVLCEYVAHHVEEEENDLFAELRQEEADMTGVAQAMARMRTDWDRCVGEAQVTSKRPRFERAAPTTSKPVTSGPGGGTARARVSRSAARKAVTQHGSGKRAMESKQPA